MLTELLRGFHTNRYWGFHSWYGIISTTTSHRVLLMVRDGILMVLWALKVMEIPSWKRILLKLLVKIPQLANVPKSSLLLLSGIGLGGVFRCLGIPKIVSEKVLWEDELPELEK